MDVKDINNIASDSFNAKYNIETYLKSTYNITDNENTDLCPRVSFIEYDKGKSKAEKINDFRNNK